MIYIIFFLLLTYYILTHSEVSLYYAFHGLTLWYNKMVPSLLPFMILSGTLVRMNLTERFVLLIHPIIGRIFRCNPNVTYGILIGFLCGFPMGARTTADLLKQNKITESEAQFLLAFNNNIGPVYFCSFVIPVLGITKIPAALFGMYGLPFIYGIILRFTVYKKELDICHKEAVSQGKHQAVNTRTDLLTALDESIRSGISSISTLCGYMIVFNLLNILPHFFAPGLQKYLSPFLEITGGIGLNNYDSPIYILSIIPFGGLSCIAQTYSMINDTKLSIKHYILHQLLLTAVTIIYYTILHRLLNINI